LLKNIFHLFTTLSADGKEQEVENKTATHNHT
jgi:hypothetical protein